MAGEIYQCTANGKTTLQDKPCPTQLATPAPGVTPTTDAPRPVISYITTPYGEWHGPIQFHAHAAGKEVPGSHLVVTLNLEIARDGKVTGSAPESGCRYLGLAMPMEAFGPQSLQLDVSTSGCAVPELNARYRGNINIPKSGSPAGMTLNSVSMAVLGRMVVVYSQATLRR